MDLKQTVEENVRKRAPNIADQLTYVLRSKAKNYCTEMSNWKIETLRTRVNEIASGIECLGAAQYAVEESLQESRRLWN